MYYESLARQRNTELDRELAQTIRTRTPMYDRPSRQRTGVGRLGHRLALIGERIRDRSASLPVGAETASLTIRPAQPTDGREIARISELNERRVPTGYVLVAELDKSIVAATPVSGGHTVTDPRRQTNDVVELLEARSRQLRLGDAPLEDAA